MAGNKRVGTREQLAAQDNSVPVKWTAAEWMAGASSISLSRRHLSGEPMTRKKAKALGRQLNINSDAQRGNPDGRRVFNHLPLGVRLKERWQDQLPKVPKLP